MRKSEAERHQMRGKSTPRMSTMSQAGRDRDIGSGNAEPRRRGMLLDKYKENHTQGNEPQLLVMSAGIAEPSATVESLSVDFAR
jgi:hypothetical protein